MFGRKQENLTKEQEEKVNKKFKEFSQRAYSEEDVNKTIENEDKILGKMTDKNLAEYLEEVKLFFCMLKDFFTRKYTDVPMGTIMAIAGSLLYVLSPFDIIFDGIPFIGLMDDAAVIALCLRFVKLDMDKYKAWKETQPKE